MTKSAEEAIREAIERGEFDNLSNKGKKLDLNAYFETPEDLRLGYSVLKNGDFIPEEVQMLKEIGVLKEKLVTAKDESERKKILKEIEARRLKYNLLMDRAKQRPV